MAAVIAIANRKGGVGKSTTAFNLAVALARRGKRVLAIDNDPQGSLTILFGHDHNKLDEEEKTLYFSLVGERPLAELAIGALNNPPRSGLLTIPTTAAKKQKMRQLGIVAPDNPALTCIDTAVPGSSLFESVRNKSSAQLFGCKAPIC